MSKKNIYIYTDGGSRGNPGVAGGGVVVMDKNKKNIFEGSFCFGTKTNNESEYLAFYESLLWVKRNKETAGIEVVNWFLDSKLVVEQINKKWKIKKDHLQKLANCCWEILEDLEINFKINHVKREKNKRADELANQAMDAIKK